MNLPPGPPARARVAVVSLHTSPLDAPGAGDSGGMNVYIRELVERLAERDVAIDVFTRCAGRGVAEVEPLGALGRVIQVPAGPCAPVPKENLPALVPAFARRFLELPRGAYDLVHAHYWLSGTPARAASHRWGAPLVASFHTLGRVKNAALVNGQRREPAVRLREERSVIRQADRVLAPTPLEASHLVDLYGADVHRIRVVSPGVDVGRFRPLDRALARRRLGLGAGPVVLFVGRLQGPKGPEDAIRAVAEAVRRDPDAMAGGVLMLVGGPSGAENGDQAARLRRLGARLGVADRLRMPGPLPHADLPWVYAAADVLLCPSRTESFGLAALEAQACGLPVVAAGVGGLRYVVADGRTGFLSPPGDAGAYAARLLEMLRDPALAVRLGRAAIRRASRLPWRRTAEEVLAVYGELVPGVTGNFSSALTCANAPPPGLLAT